MRMHHQMLSLGTFLMNPTCRGDLHKRQLPKSISNPGKASAGKVMPVFLWIRQGIGMFSECRCHGCGPISLSYHHRSDRSIGNSQGRQIQRRGFSAKTKSCQKLKRQTTIGMNKEEAKAKEAKPLTNGVDVMAPSAATGTVRMAQHHMVGRLRGHCQ